MKNLNAELPDIRGYLLSHFEQAMEQGWINIYYQPVVRSITGMVCGAEALCRWIDPEYGIISPGDLIPVLEENGRIFDLDLYVMECVCRDFHSLLNKKTDRIIPVSINLSRKDFLHEDVVERIEKIASWYQVPRELINIEVTETAFIQQQSLLSAFIEQFHTLGYQVWMDDFGTAYSSLGALKDLDFDELKIDMSFLSTASEKAKIIIEDVVRMAKRIGIQTLAEGVETKDQYEFLRRIGCEKIQGFYFGRPMTGTAFGQYCRSHHLDLEPLSWKKYYDDLGRIDYQTDTTLCVVEDDGQNMQVVFINPAYEKVLAKAGITDLNGWFHEINTPNNLTHYFYRRFVNEQLRKLPGTQTIIFPTGSHYLQLNGRVAASYENNDIYAMQIRYFDVHTKTPYQQNVEYFENLYFICDDIAVYDLASMTIYGVKSSLSEQPMGAGDKTMDAVQFAHDWIADFVYPADQERAKEFLDVHTLSARLHKNKGRPLSILLRCLDEEGQFVWKQNIFVMIPDTNGQKVLNVVMPAGLDEKTIQQITMENVERSGGQQRLQAAVTKGIAASILWRNQEQYASIKYFWKDRQRRFVGASRSFLDYYGFASVDDIVGKTDEDMHWHVQKEPFRDDELDVIEHGKHVQHKVGTCIARGVQHTIVADKMPVYQDGRIIGLMGWFIDQDEILQGAGKLDQIETIDSVTKLANTTGFLYSFRIYMRQLWERGEPFVLMHVSIPEYEIFLYTYGPKAGDQCLQAIAGQLNEAAGRENVISRITGSHFFLLLQNKSEQEMTELTKEVQTRINSLRQVGGWKFAGTADIESTMMDEKRVSRDDFASAVYDMLDHFGKGNG